MTPSRREKLLAQYAPKEGTGLRRVLALLLDECWHTSSALHRAYNGNDEHNSGWSWPSAKSQLVKKGLVFDRRDTEGRHEIEHRLILPADPDEAKLQQRLAVTAARVRQYRPRDFNGRPLAQVKATQQLSLMEER